MQATVNGARIHYERTGDGLPLFLLHAGVADHRMWEPQVAPFAKHFDVVRPDLRGFGQSELPAVRWSPVDDLLALMNTLHEKPAHLVGCSMGAQIAIDFALQHGERISKLVLVGPGIGGAEFGPKYPDLWTEVEEADKAGDMEAVNAAEMRIWLDGPRRPRGYVKEPLRSLFLDMNGTGSLSGFHRSLSMQAQCQTDLAPRTPGQNIQSFDTEMFGLQGQLPPGDPDCPLTPVLANLSCSRPK